MSLQRRYACRPILSCRLLPSLNNMRSEGFPCYYPQCTKVFYSKFNLRRHVNATHLEIKSFACDLCPRHFASKQGLIEHRYVHTGEQPYQCAVCGKRFRQASQLCIHRKCHTQTGCPLETFPMIQLTQLLTQVTPPPPSLPEYTTVYLPALTKPQGSEPKLPVHSALIL